MHMVVRPGTLNVCLVGQHRLVAEYLIQVLAKETSIRATWIGDAALDPRKLGSNPVFVVDSGTLADSASEHVRRMAGQFSHAKFVVLDHRLEAYKVCRLLSLGVQAFLTYEQVPHSLVLAIRSVSEGGMWVDSRVLQKYMRSPKRERPAFAAGDEEPLTEREEEILHLIRQRYSNKEISAMLEIEVSTVKFHLSNIFAKLGVAGRSDLWRKSPDVGVIPFQPQAVAV